MIGLSRIMRKVSLDLYTRAWEMEEKLRRAKALDAELEHWLQQVPSHLRIEHQREVGNSLKPSHRASYINKQAVVLRIRTSRAKPNAHESVLTTVQVT
jgi:hypothetical protein